MADKKGVIYKRDDYYNKLDIIDDIFYYFQVDDSTNSLVNKINELHKYGHLEIIKYNKVDGYEFNDDSIISLFFNNMIKIGENTYYIPNEDLYNIFNNKECVINTHIDIDYHREYNFICHNIIYKNEYIEKYTKIKYDYNNQILESILENCNTKKVYIFDNSNINKEPEEFLKSYDDYQSNMYLYYIIDLQGYNKHIQTLIDKSENIDEIKSLSRMMSDDIKDLIKII